VKFENGQQYLTQADLLLFGMEIPIGSILKIESTSTGFDRFWCQVTFPKSSIPTLAGFVYEAELYDWFCKGAIIINKNLSDSKSSIYCNCIEPQKIHNMGIGTLDFWVCRKCKREIK
jgi:hypothetical protein